MDATLDTLADTSAAEGGEAGPPLDCGAVAPTMLVDAKYCPYQADGGSTCPPLGDYCCEPPSGDAFCTFQQCSQIDAGFMLKCSGAENGCDLGSPCCIDAIIGPRGAAACNAYEVRDNPLGTLCGSVSQGNPSCAKGEAQICASSAECIGGSTCEPLVLRGDGGYPLWLGVCVANDGGIYTP